jgi:hypothetical protein
MTGSFFTAAAVMVHAPIHKSICSIVQVNGNATKYNQMDGGETVYSRIA